jgi:hypothetical protein
VLTGALMREGVAVGADLEGGGGILLMVFFPYGNIHSLWGVRCKGMILIGIILGAED